MFEAGELFQRGLLSPETVVDTGAYLFQNEQEYLPFATFLKSFRGMEHAYSSQVKEASAVSSVYRFQFTTCSEVPKGRVEGTGEGDGHQGDGQPDRGLRELCQGTAAAAVVYRVL